MRLHARPQPSCMTVQPGGITQRSPRLAGALAPKKSHSDGRHRGPKTGAGRKRKSSNVLSNLIAAAVVRDMASVRAVAMHLSVVRLILRCRCFEKRPEHCPKCLFRHAPVRGSRRFLVCHTYWTIFARSLEENGGIALAPSISMPSGVRSVLRLHYPLGHYLTWGRSLERKAGYRISGR